MRKFWTVTFICAFAGGIHVTSTTQKAAAATLISIQAPNLIIKVEYYTPSDNEVRTAIINYWNASENAELDQLKRNLIDARERISQYCLLFPDNRYSTLTEYLRKYSLPQSGWYYIVGMNDPQRAIRTNFASKDECVKRICDEFCGPERKKIADFRFTSKSYDITVERTNNYEGNIISYVAFRLLGTDQSEAYKVSMKVTNGKLVVINVQRA